MREGAPWSGASGGAASGLAPSAAGAKGASRDKGCTPQASHAPRPVAVVAESRNPRSESPCGSVPRVRLEGSRLTFLAGAGLFRANHSTKLAYRSLWELRLQEPPWCLPGWSWQPGGLSFQRGV